MRHGIVSWKAYSRELIQLKIYLKIIIVGFDWLKDSIHKFINSMFIVYKFNKKLFEQISHWNYFYLFRQNSHWMFYNKLFEQFLHWII